MIEKLSDNGSIPQPADSAQKPAAGAKTLYHTPFGDVMVDELSTPNLALFATKAPDQGGTPSAAATIAVPAASAATLPAAAPAVVAPAAPGMPTAQALFGSDPWLDAPGGTGPDGSKWNFNPIYFATPQTAAKIAAMVGGTVVEKDAILSAPGSPFHQSAPNQMIALPNGREVYAGLIADFYNHGYPQSFIDRLLKSEIEGTAA
jgi:hypothetical protein